MEHMVATIHFHHRHMYFLQHSSENPITNLQYVYIWLFFLLRSFVPLSATFFYLPIFVMTCIIFSFATTQYTLTEIFKNRCSNSHQPKKGWAIFFGNNIVHFVHCRTWFQLWRCCYSLSHHIDVGKNWNAWVCADQLKPCSTDIKWIELSLCLSISLRIFEDVSLIFLLFSYC